jgi:hypothetical protein
MRHLKGIEISIFNKITDYPLPKRQSLFSPDLATFPKRGLFLNA